MMAAIAVALAFQFPLSNLWHGDDVPARRARRRGRRGDGRRARRRDRADHARPARAARRAHRHVLDRDRGQPAHPVHRLRRPRQRLQPGRSPTSRSSSRSCTRTTATSTVFDATTSTSSAGADASRGPGRGRARLAGMVTTTAESSQRSWPRRCAGRGCPRSTPPTRRRAEYSSDASNYRVVPLVVAFPRSADEIERRARRSAGSSACRSWRRGAGTSIAGNALSTGLVLDTSRHLNQVLSVDPERRTAVVRARRRP